MHEKTIVEQIRQLMSKHTGKEIDLYRELCSEADGWEMRLQELEDEENDEGDE